MDLRDTPDEAAFRAELRAWLDTNLPEERRGGRGGAQRFDDSFGREWSKLLYEGGYAGLTWPKEYGGAGAPYSFQAIFYEEMARANAPGHVGVIGLGMAGPTIMAHGSEEQKQAHLSKILSAEEIWCQGFSEPDAGSDLAAARTRAERRGDVYVVNGQKVWSSFAHIADFCILVTQSDPEAPRYQNLTYLIVDMHAPGVEVRPLRQMTGGASFNEVFLNEVRVPDSHRLGDVNQGWSVALTTLMNERASIGAGGGGGAGGQMARIIETVRHYGLDTDPITRQKLADLWIHLRVASYTNQRAMDRIKSGQLPGPEMSIAKLALTQNMQQMAEFVATLLGPKITADQGEWGTYSWNQFVLGIPGMRIAGGSDEVMRNIVGERVLGLPKDAGIDSTTPFRDLKVGTQNK